MPTFPRRRVVHTSAASSSIPLLLRDLEAEATALRALDALHLVRCGDLLDDGHPHLRHDLLRGDIDRHRLAPDHPHAELRAALVQQSADSFGGVALAPGVLAQAVPELDLVQRTLPLGAQLEPADEVTAVLLVRREDPEPAAPALVRREHVRDDPLAHD